MWVQAEKRGTIRRWRDWEGSRLRDIMWYEDLEDQVNFTVKYFGLFTKYDLKAQL